MVKQKKYSYATIRITEYYDEIKEGDTVHNCNRFWVVNITTLGGYKTSMRCDSNKQFIDFIKSECKLIPSKLKKGDLK